MNDKNHIYPIICLVLGAILMGLSIAGLTDEFWSGMGSALVVVGAARLLRFYRLKKNDAYREKMEIAETDERIHFIRNKAWAWAGYLFILIAAAATILFKILGQDLLSLAASGAVCLMLVLYWISFLILNKKH